MKKTWLFLILLLMVLLCGCDGNSEPSSPVNNSSQDLKPSVTGDTVDPAAENRNEADSITKGDNLELRTYSPDGLNYIREEYDYYAPDEDWGDIVRVNLYLNDETKPLKQVHIEDLNKYIDQPRAGWLDNDNVILRGRYILNIKDMVIQNINFDKLGIYVWPAAEDYAAEADETDAQDYGYGILNYSVNKNGNKISYLFSASKEGNFYAYIYDVQKQTWEKIYSRPATFYEDNSFYDIGWDNDNNLYFSDWENVYKYDGKTVEVFFAKDTMLFYMAVSPDRQYMVVCNAGGKSDQDNFRKGQFSYIDLADGEVKFTFVSLKKNAFNPPFTWSYGDKAFAYVDTNGAVKVLSLPDMKEVLSQKVENPEAIIFIDYWDGRFIYF